MYKKRNICPRYEHIDKRERKMRMDGIFKAVVQLPQYFRKNEADEERMLEEKRIKKELENVLTEIRIAEQQFNFSSDEDLTESSIYTLTALESKYRYWYRRACTLGISAQTDRKQDNGRERQHGFVEDFIDRCRSFTGRNSVASVGEE